MARNITTDAKNASLASHVRICLLAALEFDSGTIYVSNSDRTITYGGHDYLAVGTFGSISGVEENSILAASKIDLTLTGIDPALISTAFNEHYQGRGATIYVAFLDSTYTLIADPVIVFKGTMDNMNIKIGGQGVITLGVISRLDDWNKSKVRRYNNEDQQSIYAGDKGLEFAEQTAQGVLLKVN